MPRKARAKSNSGVYHIVLRGVNRQTVFYDEEDKEVFLSRIKLAKEKHGFELFAFCLMGNHAHILLREKEALSGKIMQCILTSFVFWYNTKYGRVGNLFQDRYKSEAIESDIYLLCATRYIHQNPVKAGLAKNASEYKWSSYGAYLSGKKSMIDTDLVLSLLQGDGSYIEFMNTPEDRVFLEPFDRIRVSDEKLLKEIKRKLRITDIQEIGLLVKANKSKTIKRILEIKGCNPYQVSRVTGISLGVIRAVLARRQQLLRDQEEKR